MATADHEAAGDSNDTTFLVWDCGSALYDSYEFTAFKRQLDAAVLACGRSLSMAHFPAATPPAEADVVQVQGAGGRWRSRRRLPAMLRRLFAKVLRLRLSLSPGAARGAPYRTGDDGAGSPWSGALTSIPEEQSSSSPEMGSSPVEAGARVLRKTQSESSAARRRHPWCNSRSSCSFASMSTVLSFGLFV